ncbi:MAG: deoxyribodipyrimidine photo-lyase [Brevinematales bacterium]|nr:deoxyribodipyrimidine photo-lyase [Brevinematales bacterium]
MENMIDKRLKKLNSYPISPEGKYVLYCMEASQRISYNYALLFTIEKSNELRKPLVVIFNITDQYKHSNARYYKFMLEGIIELKRDFETLGIKFQVRKGDYVSGCIEFGKDSCLVVLDRNYLATQRKWRYEVANKLDTLVVEVDNDVVVPVELVSNKEEPYAYLIRNKIYPIMENFIHEFKLPDQKVKSSQFDLGEEFFFSDVNIFLNNLNIDKTVSTVNTFRGGYNEAVKLLDEFIFNKLSMYKEYRSDPTKNYQSNLSPYLHFGNISPVEIIHKILKNYPFEDENVQSFINELVVWRELARNFVYYNINYNKYEGIPEWAKKTLEEHKGDKREFLYTLQDFENAKTHDIYWNSAQKELLKTGKMHNYMRMYWAKKILEWTKDPKEAFDISCYLNDKYELDGRDPNGYTGISWCFGSFDRPFGERKVIGKIRYMSTKGLENKFDIKKYVEKYKNL